MLISESFFPYQMKEFFLAFVCCRARQGMVGVLSILRKGHYPDKHVKGEWKLVVSQPSKNTSSCDILIYDEKCQ